jgi:PAS domain S-box-containing protein
MTRKPRILIVEDDAFYREFLLRTLDRDYAADTAEDGLHALTRLSMESYDLILCDLRMPGISGKDLIHRIRQSTGADSVLVIITGFEKDWSPVDATDANVYAYLRKGKFGPKELRKVVQNGLLLHRESEQKKKYEERLLDFNQQLENKVVENSRALFESEEKYWNLFDQSLVGIYIQSQNRIRFSNEKLCEILGCTLSQLADRSMEDFLRPVSRENTLPSRIRTGDGFRPFQEVVLTTLDGEERYALLSSGTILFEGATATQGCLLDITEWKELEQQLLQHRKMESLGTLISGITHEFNNILAAILPQAELLLLKAQEFPAIQRPAEIISTMAEKASRLTRQLLNMSRTAILEKKPVEINTWIREALSFLGPVLGPSIQAEIDLAPDTGWIEADPQHLDQLLMNLVLNARDAMPEGGRIRITTASRSSGPSGSRTRNPAGGTFVEIAVEDSGIGIPEENLSKVFDPFFTTKETGRGTGMGLSVVYNLVRQNGGEIRVTSKPDRGSLFRILFPRLTRKEKAGESTARNGTVLVAEKNPGRQNLLRDVLARMRFDVIPARDDQEAVEIYSRKKETIDWVILDSDYLDDASLSPVTRLLHLNPRIKLLVTHRPNTPLEVSLQHPLMEPGAHIEHFNFPAKPETLFRSLEKVLEKPML